MRRFLNPIRLRDNIRKLRAVRRGGGPKRVRVINISDPKGLIAPTSDIELEIEAKDGTVTDIKTVVPVPWPIKWSWQIGRALRLPLVSELDPQKLNNLALTVPGRG